MRGLLLSAVLALVPSAFVPQEPAERDSTTPMPRDSEPSAPPRAPVAGLTGFRSKSRVVLASDPEQVLRLEAYYVFPERVRWSLLSEGAPVSQRQLYFRFGGNAWSVAPGQATSQPLEAAGLGSISRRLEIHRELRRCAMLWPNGLEWAGTGSVRTAQCPVEASPAVDPSTGESLPLVVSAHLDDAGRLHELEARRMHADGSPGDMEMALRDITWREQGDRWWPHTFTLVGYEDVEWRETVESVDVGINAIDSFFIPPDRRDTTGLAISRAPMLVKLPPSVQRRHPLPADTSFEEALLEATRLIDEESARLAPIGGRLEPGFAIELDASALPRAVLLRLEQEPSSLPTGWERIPAREAATAIRSGAGPAPGSSLRRLAELLPAGAVASAPYVRFRRIEGGETAGLQIVLPFRRAE